MREPARFTIRQARRRGGVAGYRLRHSGFVIFLRHNTPDVNTLDQIFAQGHYRPPTVVDEILRRDDSSLEVLDLGANIGLFAAFVLARAPSARVVCFEPDPDNAAIVRRTIDENPGFRWELVEACAAASDGTVRFTTGLFTNSRIEQDGGGELVKALDVFPYIQSADYLKIDIEGAEWEILDDPRFSTIRSRVVALEYHDYLSPGPDPARQATAALEGAGFETADAEFETSPGHGMIWAWKTP